MGHWGPKCCGGKPLQPRNAPSPRNAPPTGSQQRKSRCPPRSHNYCCGWGNKTNTIDFGKDHSPQDEIALHYIQPHVTVRNTHPKEIMVRDVCAPQCNEAYTTIQLPASASRKGTASLHIKVNKWAGGNVLPLCVFWHLYPDQISPAGLPTGLNNVSTRLTAYNRSHIPLYGALHGPITWQPDHPGAGPHRVNSYWYVADTPGPCHPLLYPQVKKNSREDELCHHSQATWHMSCTCFHNSSCNQGLLQSLETAKSIRSTDDLIKEFPDWFMGIGRFPGKFKIQLCHNAHPVIHAPQEMPHHLTSKGQGAPWQDGMPRHDHPCGWTNRLGILHNLCPEGKWQATSVLGSPWPQWGHPLWSSQDAHCGGSCSWVHTLLLLHQVGCLPWILVNHPQPGLQLAYNFQQSLQRILFPATSLWPGLFPRHLPEEDGSDPWRMPRMYQNCRWHHHPWLHRGRTWCMPTRSYAYCLQIQLGVQPTENTCEGSSHLFLWLPLQYQWWPLRPRKGRCSTHLAYANKCHQTPRVLRPNHTPKSPSSLACPCWLPLYKSCSRRTQTSHGTRPTMLLLSGSKKLSSVTPPSGILTHHFPWQYRFMPHR